VRFSRLSDLPTEHHCNQCGKTKPLVEMLVIHIRKSGAYELRPRCKDCQNKRERGHRRPYKTSYLKRWRAKHRKTDKSYRETDKYRETARLRQSKYIEQHHDQMAIRRRLMTRGIRVTLKEAAALLQRFGPCYPTRFGLTKKGLSECERIRSKLRRSNRTKKFSSFDIRLMVYEDGLFITPGRQPIPYERQAERMRELRRSQGQAQVRQAA